MIRQYAEIPLIVAMKEEGSLSKVETLATVAYLEEEADRDFDLERVSLIIYETQQECLDAVSKGTADAVLCDGYLSEYLMGTELSYSDMEVKGVFAILDHMESC